MSRNYYCEIHLHLAWHTKLSAPLLTPDVESVVYRHVRQLLVAERGVYLQEIGGIETHVHLAVTIQPHVPISDLVGRLKGSSAYAANQELAKGQKILEWQTGYGVLSFGTKDLEWVTAYIRNQRTHHQQGTVHERLERTTAREDADTTE
jgi:putative transposase